MSFNLKSMLIGLVVCCLYCSCPISAWAYKADAGVRAANFKGYDIVSKETIELEDYFGQWVLVEFWATWCQPCVSAMPHLSELAEKFEGKPRKGSPKPDGTRTQAV